MRDLVSTPGFTHLSPRERLRRHATNKIADRFGWRPSPEEYEALCAQAEAFTGRLEDDAGPASSREIQCWPDFRGQKVRVIFDRRYRAIVTVITGWYPRPGAPGRGR
jgi:hypothetical protein